MKISGSMYATILSCAIIYGSLIAGSIVVSTRILNGLLAREGQFPHMVQLSISSNNTSSGRKYCGGSLISAEWIVTAAHCFKNGKVATAFAGTVFLRKVRRKVLVSKIVIHPKYATDSNFDIALLKLTKPLMFDQLIQSISLPVDENDNPKVDEVLTVPGFGETKNASQSQMYLRYVNMKVISNEDCNNEWYRLIKYNLMCAQGNQSYLETTCSGDSGNGLIRTGENGTSTTLFGIVSYGAPGCIGQPKVFVRVSSHLNFIKNVIAGN